MWRWCLNCSFWFTPFDTYSNFSYCRVDCRWTTIVPQDHRWLCLCRQVKNMNSDQICIHYHLQDTWEVYPHKTVCSVAVRTCAHDLNTCLPADRGDWCCKEFTPSLNKLVLAKSGDSNQQTANPIYLASLIFAAAQEKASWVKGYIYRRQPHNMTCTLIPMSNAVYLPLVQLNYTKCTEWIKKNYLAYYSKEKIPSACYIANMYV